MRILFAGVWHVLEPVIAEGDRAWLESDGFAASGFARRGVGQVDRAGQQHGKLLAERVRDDGAHGDELVGGEQGDVPRRLVGSRGGSRRRCAAPTRVGARAAVQPRGRGGRGRGCRDTLRLRDSKYFFCASSSEIGSDGALDVNYWKREPCFC